MDFNIGEHGEDINLTIIEDGDSLDVSVEETVEEINLAIVEDGDLLQFSVEESVEEVNLTIIENSDSLQFSIEETVEEINLTIEEGIGGEGIGIKGDKPAHEWKGTSLRFENPDDTWGSYVNLKGKDGSETVTKTSDLTNDGDDGINPFVTAIDISNKAERNASNITDVISWRESLDIYNKGEVDTKFHNGGREQLTTIQKPTLSGDVLTINYKGENGVVQQQSVNLAGLVTSDTKLEEATYVPSTNTITLRDTSGEVFIIDLSELSVISTTNTDGFTTLTQEGVEKIKVSKVGRTGDYGDLLNVPTPIDVTRKADVNASNLTQNAIVQWRDKLSIDDLEQRIIDSDTRIDEELNEINLEISDVDNNLKSLQDSYLDFASDGVFTIAETEALKAHIEILDREIEDVYAKFQQIYANPNLKSEQRNKLNIAYNNLYIAHTSLKEDILSAIQDGLSTEEEAASLKLSFKTYREKLALLTRAFEVAINAIFNRSLDDLRLQIDGEIDDINLAITGLDEQIESLPIGQVSDAALFAIRQQKNLVHNEYTDLTSRYNVIYNDAFLINKEPLATAYGGEGSGYVKSFNDLFNYLDTAFSDSDITQVEKDTLQSLIDTYRSSLEALSVQLQEALKVIEESKISGLRDELTDEITEVRLEVGDVDTRVTGLQTSYDEFATDGVFSIAEAKALQSYINTLENEKADLQTKFNVIYSNVFLDGIPKTSLASSYSEFNLAHTELIAQINLAISDGIATAEDKIAVDASFVEYRLALANLSGAYEVALNYITNQKVGDLTNKIFDGTGFFDPEKIKPLSIQTKHIAIGDRMQRFTLPGIRFYLENNYTTLRYTAGQIIHQTVDVTPKTWAIAAGTQTGLINGFLYLYIKASRTGSTATILATNLQINVEQDPNYYHFEAGYISALQNGFRTVKTTFGFAQINPAELSIGKWSNPNNPNQYIEHTEEGLNVVAKRVTFRNSENVSVDVEEAIGVIDNQLETLNQTRDYVETTLQTDLEDLKNRADGVIESWFYSHSPNLSNLPASNWTTNELKDSHIGDTFTNMQEFVDNTTTPDAGKAWRFARNANNTYSWNLIANSDSTKALIEAGKAKDTADSKRRVFIAQPFPPYDLGDLWSQGTSGDLMRCKFARTSGVYVATDWEKASKYTDDTRAIQAETAAKEYTDDIKSQIDGELSDLATEITNLSDAVTDLPIGDLTDTVLFGIKQQKNSVQSEYQDVYSRYLIIRDDAALLNKLPVTDAFASYYNAYNSLITYFDITFNDSAITQAEKDELTARFTTYKNQVSLFATALQNAVQAIQEQKIDNIQIGGRNLLIGTTQNEVSLISGVDYTEKIFNVNYEADTDYVFSAYMKGTQATLITFNPNTLVEYKTLTNEYKLYVWRFKNISAAATLFYIRSQAGQSVYFKKPKLEKGNKATDYTPSPEDVAADIITSKTAAEAAAKLYADAQDNAKETTTKAYADGIVTAAEQRSINDATAKANAAKAYADAQDVNLKILIDAQTDGKISTLETELINSSETNLEAAKSYADAQAEAAREAAKAWADGEITAEEQARIAQADANLTNAKNYAEAQDVLLKTQQEAYADNKVSVSEAAAIAEAKAYADLKKAEAEAYADGIVDEEEQARLNQALLNLNEAKAHADTAVDNIEIGGRNLAHKGSYGVWGGLLTNQIIGGFDISGTPTGISFLTNLLPPNTYYYLSFKIKKLSGSLILIGGHSSQHLSYKILVNGVLSPQIYWQEGVSLTDDISENFIEVYGKTAAVITDRLYIQPNRGVNIQADVRISELNLQLSNTAIAFTPAPEDIQAEITNSKTAAEAAAKLYADAQDNAKETTTKAYADGIVTAAEQRSITDATNKADAAKTYATAQDALLQTQVNAYTDGKITVEEQARIQSAQNAVAEAKNYSDAQDNLAKIAAAAYADGIVDAEEARAIADATSKMEAAKTHAQTLVSNIQIGGRNLAHKESYNLFNGTINRILGGFELSGTSATGISFKLGTIKSGEDYYLSLKTKKLDGDVITLGGHSIQYPSSKIFIDGVAADTNSWQQAIIYPNDNDVHFIEVYGKANNNLSEPFYLQINRNITDVYSSRIEVSELNLQISTKKVPFTPAPEDIDAEFVLVKSEINDVDNKLSNLQTNFTDFASDGVINIAEAKALKNIAQTLNNEKVDVEQKYIQAYNDVNLIDKTLLQTAWNSYSPSHDTLLSYINTYTAGNRAISPAELATVNIAFTNYRNALSALSAALETSLKAIADRKINVVQVDATAAKAQATNAQNTAAAAAAVTSFLQTDVNTGNVVSTGTLQVGSATGANAGITGVVDRAGASVRFYAGSTYAGKNTARWLVRDDGVEEQWYNGVLIQQNGIIGGVYAENSYNLNGQLGKRKTYTPDGKIMEEWYYNGVLAYQIGQNGIYYVSEIPESFALIRFLNLNSNASTSDGSVFHNTLRSFMYQKSGNPSQFELRGNKDAYLYNAGQNVYSQGNKQYEGYKNTQVKTDNLADGWYAVEQLGWMDENGTNPTRREAQIMRISAGKTVQSISTIIETQGYTFNQF